MSFPSTRLESLLYIEGFGFGGAKLFESESIKSHLFVGCWVRDLEKMMEEVEVVGLRGRG